MVMFVVIVQRVTLLLTKHYDTPPTMCTLTSLYILREYTLVYMLSVIIVVGFMRSCEYKMWFECFLFAINISTEIPILVHSNHTSRAFFRHSVVWTVMRCRGFLCTDAIIT